MVLPPPLPPKGPVGFQDTATIAGLVVSIGLLVSGIVLVLAAGGALAAMGASFITLGSLGLLSLGFGSFLEWRRLRRPIPLDPDRMRRSPERDR